MSIPGWARHAVPAILITVWAASLFLPVATTYHVNENQTFVGWMVMALGMAFGWATFQFAAFANPLFLYALAYSSWRRAHAARRLLRGAALFLALAIVSALFWRSIPDDSGLNEIVTYHVGYFVWIMAMAGAAAWLWVSTGRTAED